MTGIETSHHSHAVKLSSWSAFVAGQTSIDKNQNSSTERTKAIIVLSFKDVHLIICFPLFLLFLLWSFLGMTSYNCSFIDISVSYVDSIVSNKEKRRWIWQVLKVSPLWIVDVYSSIFKCFHIMMLKQIATTSVFFWSKNSHSLSGKSYKDSGPCPCLY